MWTDLEHDAVVAELEGEILTLCSALEVAQADAREACDLLRKQTEYVKTLRASLRDYQLLNLNGPSTRKGDRNE